MTYIHNSICSKTAFILITYMITKSSCRSTTCRIYSLAAILLKLGAYGIIRINKMITSNIQHINE